MHRRFLAIFSSSLTLSGAAFAQAPGGASRHGAQGGAPAAQTQNPQTVRQAVEGAGDSDKGDANDSGGGSQGAETEGQDVSDQRPEGDHVKMTKDGKDTAPGEVHTVVKGDTLWDLSQKFLGSPWYWPKVWSYNPEIANPHWIYPGNQVRFFAAGEEGPSRVEVENAPNEPPPEVAKELPELNEDEVPLDSLEEDTKVHVSGEITYHPKTGVKYAHAGFVTPHEIQETGVIEAARTDALRLTIMDTAYVSFKNRNDVKVGDRYIIYKTLEEVKHPINGGTVGVLTKLLGVLKVVPSEKANWVKMQVVEAWDEIHRGDFVGPFGEHVRETIDPKPNDHELSGYVVTAFETFLTIMGERSLIIIDKGSKDGVQPGNTFTIVRRADPSENMINPNGHENPNLPLEDAGACMAMEVKETATTCMLMRSMSEIVKGDRVLMRTASHGSTGSDVKVGAR